MKKILILTVIFCSFASTYSQTSSNSLKNLKSDYIDFSNAMLNSNTNKLRELLYPGIFTLLMEVSPNENKQTQIDEFIENVTVMIKDAEKLGFSIVNRNDGDIIQIVNYSNKEIWLIESLTDFRKGERNIETNEVVLAISLNGGENFTFVGYDSDLIEDVLKYEFSAKSIIDVKRLARKYSD